MPVSTPAAILSMLLAAASLPASRAAIRITATLGDYAVLQRDAQDPPAIVWGFGSPGVTVSASMDGTPLAGPPATVGADGIWRVPFPPTPADIGGGAGHTLTFTASDGGTASLAHVLFGDVWSCGGQSNMQFVVSQAFNASAEIAAADAYASVFRIFTVGGENNTPQSAQVDLNATAAPWAILNSTSVGDFSAVCYFMARDTYSAMVAAGAGAVPFGLIANNVGGTSIELWSRGNDLASCNASAPYPGPYTNGTLYDGMIAPYSTGPTAMQGWLWYQAEANAPPYQHAPDWYACTFPALISGWRSVLQQPALPFLFVQLAPFNGTDGWEDIRQAQLTALALPNVGYGTMIDNGDPTSPFGTYHPRNKQLIGARLALAALDLVYAVPTQWRAPELESAVFTSSGSTASVTAAFASGTLTPKGLAVVPASCPVSETIPASYCSDYSIFFQPAPQPNYTYVGPGFLAAGNDCGTGNYTVAQAQAACTSIPSCVGFTFQSPDPHPSTPVTILFKSSVSYFQSDGWQAYGSDRDVRGQRVPATGTVSADGRTVVLTATGGPGQTAVAAAYGWATWPVTPLMDAGSGLPVIPWMVTAGAGARDE